MKRLCSPSLSRFSALIAALAAIPATGSANLIINGSFESYGGTGFNSNIGAGLDGWTIGPNGGIDIALDTDWQAADGIVSITLNWGGPEYVSQTVSTVAGTQYNVSFFMAAEIYGGTQFRTMDVIWNDNVVGTPSFEYTGQGPTNMGWTKFNYVVTATGSDVLKFYSTTDANYGPALDNISLTAVPEPGVAIAMGLGCMFTALRRKRTS